MTRFVVKECSGWEIRQGGNSRSRSGSAPRGYIVTDTAVCSQTVNEWWAGQQFDGIAAKAGAERCRRAAETLAERLNGEHPS